MAVDDNPDALLLARCQRGGEDAFRELVERHHDRVYRIVYALVGNPIDAEEVEQETFVKAWRALPKFRGDAALETWLTTLALNAARDHLRRQRTRKILQQLLGRTIEERPLPADPSLQNVEDRDTLERALGRLNLGLRQVVALRYGVGLSTREMAAVLGCPEGTVKSRLNSALGQLRSALAAEPARKGRRFPWPKEVRGR